MRKEGLPQVLQPVGPLRKFVREMLLSEVLQLNVDRPEPSVPLPVQQWLLELRVNQPMETILSQVERAVLPSWTTVPPV